jgi:large subunit ribosomal protein L13
MSEKIVIDAEGCTMGRLAAYSAKAALGGKNVVIFNAEKAVISGKESEIFPRYKRRYDAKSNTNPRRYGPKRPKNPDRLLRRVIRGMLPWSNTRGREAFKKVMVYIGRPEAEIKKKEGIELSKAVLFDNAVFKKHYDYFITLGDLCAYLGGRNE